jgi:hypothetical protein
MFNEECNEESSVRRLGLVKILALLLGKAVG